MWIEGGRYGSIDPCFPSKVIQSTSWCSISTRTRNGKPLDYIYYPCMTNMPTYITDTITPGRAPSSRSPNVVKAAFTKETDFFTSRHRVGGRRHRLQREELLKKRPSASGVPASASPKTKTSGRSTRPTRHSTHSTRTWRPRTRHHRASRARESRRHPDDRASLPQRSRPQPRHPRESQVMGYPVARSLPKDRAWLSKYFGTDDPRRPRRLARELFDQLGAEGLGGALRGSSLEHRLVDLSSLGVVTTRRPTASSTTS